jgi:ABC-type phosphate transport system substrate-binding protein
VAGVIRLMLLPLLVALLPLSAHAAERQVVLIAHPQVTNAALTRDTTRAIFAMRQRSWPDGQAVRVFVLPNNHPVHARFAKERLTVYPHQLQLAWDRMVFSGTGQAPSQVGSQIEMLERVATTPGALGYLEREYLDDRVQVITME